MNLGELAESFVILSAFPYNGNTGGVVYVRGTRALLRYVDNGAGQYNMDAHKPYDMSATDLDTMVEVVEDWHFGWMLEQEEE